MFSSLFSSRTAHMHVATEEASALRINPDAPPTAQSLALPPAASLRLLWAGVVVRHGSRTPLPNACV